MKKQTTSCSNANDHKQIMKDDNDNPIIVRTSLVDLLANPIAIQQQKINHFPYIVARQARFKLENPLLSKLMSM
jgi:hypothetical protein